MDAKTSMRVTKYIANEIKQGNIQVGEKLPSERELMEILNVGRSSVRESLSTFVDMGVLEKRMGIGVFVKKTDLNNLVDSYMISALLDRKTSIELMEFRLLLEVETAGLAAKMAKEGELQAMQEAMELHVKAIETDKTTIKADMLFHQAIAMATGNGVLVKVYDGISDLLESLKQDLSGVESKQKSLAFHRKIYQAIKQGDENEAKVVMKEHLLDVMTRHQNLNDPSRKKEKPSILSS